MDQLPYPTITIDITIKGSLEKCESLLTHYEVDDSHQEYDSQVVLIPYELVLRSMCPLLQQCHQRSNVESLYPCG
jgi:hypothetical protein